MKRSLIGRFGLLSLALAVAAASFVGDFASGVKDRVVRTYHAVLEAMSAFALKVVDVVAPKLRGYQLFQVLRSRAKEFHARIARRERPQITNNWRMCPSA